MNTNRTQIGFPALLVPLFVLAGCGSKEQPPAEPDPVADEPAPVEATQQPADDAGEETLEVVEESAADVVEDDDQPILLARADEPAADREWKFKEGQHYTRMVPTQPTFGGAEKIEVAEFFWFGCPHCYDLERYTQAWLADKPADVRFVYVPATWNRLVAIHARLHYTAEALSRNGELKEPKAFRQAVFREYHERRNQMASEDAIKQLFARFDVSEEQFEKTWNSFEVEQNLRKASDLARRYSISSVPQMVVNGKYRTGGQEAGGYATLLEVVTELVEKERIR